MNIRKIIMEEIAKAINEDPYIGGAPIEEVERPGAGRTASEIKTDVRAAGKKLGKSSKEIEKVIDMIDGIEESGKKYNRSKEYVARTIHDKLPTWAIKKPSAMHGPEKSGPKSEK